jgi:hypothetical protein
MALGRCPDCGGKRAWSSTRCPHCGSTRDSSEAGGAKALAGGGAAMAGGFLLMGWPDRIFFLAVVLGLGATGTMYRTHDVWAAWVVWLFMGGVLGLVLWSARLIIALFVGARVSWAVLLASVGYCVYRFGAGYMAWLEHHH